MFTTELIYCLCQSTTQYYKLLMGPPEGQAAAAESLSKLLLEFDKELQKRGNFLGGKEN